MMRCWNPSYQGTVRLTNHHFAGTKRHLKTNTGPHYLTEQLEIQQLGDIHMTCDAIWKREQVKQDQSMDHGGAPRRTMTAIWLNVRNITTPGLKTAYELHLNYITTWPDIEVPQTPFASLTK